MRVIRALWLRNLKAFFRNRAQLTFAIVMLFFLPYVFSRVFPMEDVEHPMNYVLAGVVIACLFQMVVNLAWTIVTDTMSGFMKEVLVSPIKRVHIVLGQLMAVVTIAFLQGGAMLVIWCLAMYICQ